MRSNGVNHWRDQKTNPMGNKLVSQKTKPILWEKVFRGMSLLPNFCWHKIRKFFYRYCWATKRHRLCVHRIGLDVGLHLWYFHIQFVFSYFHLISLYTPPSYFSSMDGVIHRALHTHFVSFVWNRIALAPKSFSIRGNLTWIPNKRLRAVHC